MRTFKSFFALLALMLAAQPLIAQSKGVFAISTSDNATSADYDRIVATMKEKGVWETGWSFHALGTADPKGVFSIGFYSNKEAFDKRMEVTKPIFEAAGIKPSISSYEIHNSFVGTLPTTKPAAGIVAHFTGSGMTAAQYDQVLVELAKVTTFPAAGQMAHVCYKTDDGHKVVDVWESAEQFAAFGEKLVPILQRLGINAGQPTVYGLYNYLKTSN